MKTLLCVIIIWTTQLPFCIIKFKFVERMREYLPWGTKMHFLCFTCTGSWFFNTVHKFKFSKDRPMSLWKLKCLNLLPNGNNRHWFWKPENSRFYRINIIRLRDLRHCRWCPYALFCGSRLTLLEEMYRDSGGFVFHRVSLVKERAVYWNVCSFARKSPEMLISLTF